MKYNKNMRLNGKFPSQKVHTMTKKKGKKPLQTYSVQLRSYITQILIPDKDKKEIKQPYRTRPPEKNSSVSSKQTQKFSHSMCKMNKKEGWPRKAYADRHGERLWS